MNTIGALCAKYAREYPALGVGYHYGLKRIERDALGSKRAPGTSRDFIDFCRRRRRECSAATVLNDIARLRSVLAYAKPGWGLADVTAAPLVEALPVLRKEGLIGTAKRRHQIPVPDQIAELVAHFRARPFSVIPMDDITEFQYESGRRVSETCRLQRGDLNADAKTILVRDMKHPRHKIGNDVWVALPDRAFAILMRQPKRSNDPHERFFPYISKSVSSAFADAVEALGFTDLRLHDCRRATTTNLLRDGRTVPEVMLVTGHLTPGMVLTTYNGLRAEDFHKERIPQC